MQGSITGTNNLVFAANTTGVNILYNSNATSINNAGTITNSGTGTNTVFLSSAIIGANVTGVIQNSATSVLSLGAANLFSGGLTVDQGTAILTAGNTGTTSGAAGPSANAITLGSSSGNSTVGATLLASVAVSNPVNLATSAVGPLTIGNSGAAGSGNFSGALNLNGNNVTFANTGTGTVTEGGLITAASGTTLTVNSTGTGLTTISGTSPNFAGAVAVTAGILNLTGHLGCYLGCHGQWREPCKVQELWARRSLELGRQHYARHSRKHDHEAHGGRPDV